MSLDPASQLGPAPSAGLFEGREHRLPVRVYYEDTDLTGLVYHASYVRFLERGRSDFLRRAGVDHVAMAAQDTAFAVTRLEIAFRRPARIDDALVVHTVFERIAGAVLHIRQWITRGDETLAQGVVEVACIRLDGRARRPPPALSAALRSRLAAQACGSGPD